MALPGSDMRHQGGYGMVATSNTHKKDTAVLKEIPALVSVCFNKSKSRRLRVLDSFNILIVWFCSCLSSGCPLFSHVVSLALDVVGSSRQTYFDGTIFIGLLDLLSYCTKYIDLWYFRIIEFQMHFPSPTVNFFTYA